MSNSNKFNGTAKSMKDSIDKHHTNSTQVLIIEDDFLFSTVIKHLLTEASFEARNIDNAASISEVSALVSELNPDVILLDLNITDSHGEATYLSVSKLFPSVPIIILSGMEDNDLALKIVKDGAQDYILKSDVNASLLTKSIEYGIERKQLINSIRESEKKFRNVFDNSPLPMLIIEPNLKIEASNYVAQNFYGLTKAKIETMNFNEMNSGEVLWSIDSVFDSFNKRIIQRDFKGRDLHVELVGNKIAIDQEKYICLVIDRTDEYLFEQNKYKIVNEVQEKEKKLLAMELHDGLCQQLVLLNLWLQSIKVDEKYSDTKANIDQLISSVITEARNLSYQLLPPDLENGFIQSLSTLVQRMQRLHDISFEFYCEEGISETTFTGVDIFNLYRIIQEFVNNSIKHANCTKLTISIERTGEMDVLVTVRDNGKGFDQRIASVGLGMQSIEHRIAMGNLVGGVFSEVDKGTSLTLRTDKGRINW